MLPLQRRQRILRDIVQWGVVLVPTLSEQLGVSEMTIRRDLKALEEDGHLQRTHGGAMVRSAPHTEPHIIARAKRQKLFAAQKRQIARYAARAFVADGDIIILEGGTTVATMIPFLVDKQELTVVTNGLVVINELQRLMPPRTTIICAGGILRGESSTFVGPVAERFFGEFHAHRVFLSGTGLTLKAGVTDPNMVETQVKRAMVASANEVTLLLDSSKVGINSLMTVLDLGEIQHLVTDKTISGELMEGLRTRNVQVWVAPEEEP